MVVRVTRTIAWVIALCCASSTAACAADVSVTDSEHVAQTEEAITNGKDDSKDPAVVALLLSGQVLCTGFLVSSHVVVTAAHCVDQVQPDAVYFGSDPRSKTGTTIKVSDSQAHPDFDSDTLDNDVGVVGLAEAAPVKPLRVMTGAFNDKFVGAAVRVVGFGAKQGGGAAQSKHSGVSSITAFSEQDFRFKGAPSQTCEGDSGGPAFATVGGEELVIGITSSGDTDCKAYGRDIRMDAFATWFSSYSKSYKAPAPPAESTGCAITARPRARSQLWLAALGCAVALVVMSRRMRA